MMSTQSLAEIAAKLQGYDLKSLLRNSGTPESITEAIAAIWSQRGDRYSELRKAESLAVEGLNNSPDTHMRKVEMSYIGG